MKTRALAAVLLALMLGSALAAALMKPHIRLADELGTLSLEREVPKVFGPWQLDTSGPAQIVNPQTKEALDKIYSQTLSRVYINASSGERVMLTIAYGSDQRDAMQLHYPEVCYRAQGFTIRTNDEGLAQTPLGAIPVRRLTTSLGSMRPEPVTYWTTVGERAVRGDSAKKIAEMSYGLSGRIPDGLLFRISTINPDSAQAFGLLDRFIQDIVPALPAQHVARFTGLHAAAAAPSTARP